MPRLAVFDMGELADWENLRNLSVKIIDGSPSLKKLKGNDFDAEFLGYVSEEKYALLDNFTLAVETDSEEKKCSTLALAEPALSSLWLLAPSESGSRYKRSFINVLEKLLSSSCQTMEALTMSSPTFPLNILSISPLVNLRSMTFLEDGTASHLLHNLRAVDYTKLLPALLEVKIAVGSEVGPNDIIMNHWEEQQEAQLVQVHPSATVKHLSVRAEFNLLTFEDLSPIFPNVVNLELDAQLMHPLSPNASAVWRDLWACWPHLESVSLDYQRGALRWNFDAEFLGVHSEEVEILRGMDKPSLEKLNLVPIRPSVLIFSRKMRH